MRKGTTKKPKHQEYCIFFLSSEGNNQKQKVRKNGLKFGISASSL
jgi:hypothetical protein